jgi:outer membrane protein OmpA-like peptidoglycan-associated protein
MNSDVLFPVGSSALSDVGRGKIREIAQVLTQYPDSDVFVRGYTSSEGEDQMNFELSQRRAEVVRNELIADGVDAARVDARGMGESNPIATNDTEPGRIQNRRVEINVVPRGNAS